MILERKTLQLILLSNEQPKRLGHPVPTPKQTVAICDVDNRKKRARRIMVQDNVLNKKAHQFKSYKILFAIQYNC